ncbi:MAG: hypothetical protein IPH03_11450 [Tetrasphaera sp.]|nr:hypothetical protein [Tetrasphaera sp.]
MFFTDNYGDEYPIVDWTHAGVIRNQIWKTVKVVAQGPYFSWSVNGRILWSGYDYNQSVGSSRLPRSTPS